MKEDDNSKRGGGVIRWLSGLVKDYTVGLLEGCRVVAKAKEGVEEECENGGGDMVDSLPDSVRDGIRARSGGGGAGRESPRDLVGRELEVVCVGPEDRGERVRRAWGKKVAE